ncbi:protein kinase domain-containing protein [Frigoriglobus tundricola]|nr:protein kinase [Frigoriglobus tundricola]
MFKCYDPDRDRFVAVKVALDEIRAPAERDAFLHHAERAAAIEHENLCAVYEIGLASGRPFLVMPYYESGTLAQWMRANPVAPVRATLDRIFGLARGLGTLHTAGIVHRALKPDNIFIDGDKLVVSDYGWARADGTAASPAGGVNRYMAPEQWRPGGAFVPGPRSDVFSLGAILYELLTGTHPFPWLSAEVLAQGVGVWAQRLRLPSEAYPGLDTRLNPLCLRALETNPNDRYASAHAFAEEIDRIRRLVDAERLITTVEDFKQAEAYYYGAPGVPRDPDRARRLFERAAAQGYAPAQNSLGSLYQYALGVPRDYEKACELYELAAAQGDARAQNNLGYMYLKGLGVPRDYRMARELYEKAVAQGDAAGQYSLGCLYLHELGVPLNYARALELYVQSAAQGYAKAQNGLGFMYLEGLGVPQDYAKALELFELSAKQGFAVAQNSLGFMYLKGLGVPLDYTKARYYLEKAQAQGNAQAYSSLGYMYQYGMGVEQDFRKARELFEKAMKKGLAEAFYNLGYMYHNGLGLKKDYAKARQLYESAAARGDEDAQKALEKMDAPKKPGRR